jgi:hypothetical protein
MDGEEKMPHEKIEVTYTNITDINPAEYNPRTISDDEFTKLKKGLEEFGIVDPLIANKDMTLIGGHQRLKAAKELGWSEVPVIILDVDKAQEKALNLALNKLKGEWDYGKLTSLLKELDDLPDFDIELTGFDVIEATEITELMNVDASAILNDGGFGDDPGATDPAKTRGTIFQYSIIFQDEDEQQIWHQWLKDIKDKHPDLPTISERIIAEITTGQ